MGRCAEDGRYCLPSPCRFRVSTVYKSEIHTKLKPLIKTGGYCRELEQPSGAGEIGTGQPTAHLAWSPEMLLCLHWTLTFAEHDDSHASSQCPLDGGQGLHLPPIPGQGVSRGHISQAPAHIALNFIPKLVSNKFLKL